MYFRSRKLANHEENIEITLTRENYIIPWPTEDNSKIKLTTTLTNEPQELTQSNSCSSLNVNYDSKSIVSDLSTISSLDGPIDDIYWKRRKGSSRYQIHNRTRIESSILNHFLDFLSTCFWKCSTGCQQLPEKY